ncbi:MAG: hypothetical protein PHQ66_01475 [Candidatus Nanoarchaeia archaeon]|nr:hypothetical protein [Candidatus Nanoarchaeia archaeon]MDD5357953.1 hypothetical protein [Candidatus Nanoarchaeia archaeon]MDD5588872.1 hypothetical protein [Candidatus Nanoarchaeia archaeon]
MYKNKIIRSGLSKEQKTKLSNYIFYGGFTCDKYGKNIYTLPMIRRERHYVEAGFLGETYEGYYLELRNIGMEELKEAHSKLEKIAVSFDKNEDKYYSIKKMNTPSEIVQKKKVKKR